METINKPSKEIPAGESTLLLSPKAKEFKPGEKPPRVVIKPLDTLKHKRSLRTASELARQLNQSPPYDSVEPEFARLRELARRRGKLEWRSFNDSPFPFGGEHDDRPTVPYSSSCPAAIPSWGPPVKTLSGYIMNPSLGSPVNSFLGVGPLNPSLESRLNNDHAKRSLGRDYGAVDKSEDLWHNTEDQFQNLNPTVDPLQNQENGDENNNENNNEIDELHVHEIFSHKCQHEAAMHSLAAQHYGALHKCFFFVPSTVITLVNGILAIFAASESSKEKTNTTLNVAIGVLSFVLTFVQSQSEKHQYETKAKMHTKTAEGLEALGTKLEECVKIRRRTYRKSSQHIWSMDMSNASVNEETLQTNITTNRSPSQIFHDIQLRREQCVLGCDSKIPEAITSAFKTLSERLDMTMTTAGHELLQNQYGSNYYNIIQDSYLQELRSQIISDRFWPLCLPDANAVVDATMNNLQWNTTHLSTYWQRAFQPTAQPFALRDLLAKRLAGNNAAHNTARVVNSESDFLFSLEP